jgi:hypothetical protein
MLGNGHIGLPQLLPEQVMFQRGPLSPWLATL